MSAEDKFTDYLEATFPSGGKRSRSAAIHREYADRIISYLKGGQEEDKQFRYLVKNSKFELLDFPKAGLRDVLVIRVKEGKQAENDRTIMKYYRRVAIVEEFWSILKQVHDIDCLHAGIKKTYSRVQEIYSHLPRSVVNHYGKLCTSCNLRKPQATQAPLKPIVANGFFSRLQIDLIDMRHLPDEDYKWILHGVDHWSKFQFAYPLINKSAIDVAMALQTYIFPIMGLPSILQSDNGREFVNQVIREVLESWPGQVQLVNGRPRHPQSQGLVEQANYTLERMLSAKIAENSTKSPPWSEWLSHIVYTLNTQVHESTNKMPYEVVFGQPPRSTVVPDVHFKGNFDEEDLGTNDSSGQENQSETDDIHGILDDGDERHVNDDGRRNEDGHESNGEDYDGWGNRDDVDEWHENRDDANGNGSCDDVDDGKGNRDDANGNGRCDDVDDGKGNRDDANGNGSCDVDDGKGNRDDGLENHSETVDRYVNRSDSDNGHGIRDGGDYEQVNRDGGDDKHGNEDDGVARHSVTEDEREKKGKIDMEAKEHRPLATTEKHFAIRQDADIAYHKSIERMKKRYSKQKGKKIRKFEIGDNVSVRIPRIDRTNTDQQRLPCIIVKTTGKAQEFYKLCCKGGIIKTHFLASDLEHFCGSFGLCVEGWEEEPVVSLREAAKVQSPWNVFVANRCQCKPETCKTKRCKCRRSGIDCSSHCHHGLSCTNKKYEQTEEKENAMPKECDQSDERMGMESDEDDQHGQRSSKRRRVDDRETTSQAKVTCKCKNCNAKKSCPCRRNGVFCSKMCHPAHHCNNEKNLRALQNTIDLTNCSTATTENSSEWTEIEGVMLSVHHKQILDSSARWLDDIIHAGQILLKKQFPMIGSLQAPCLAERLAMEPPAGEFVQVLNSGNSHWFTISNIGCSKGNIIVYDSLHLKLTSTLKRVIADLMMTTEKVISVKYAHVQCQSGANDCGLFAVAFATSLCNGNDPEGINYNQSEFRSHLKACLLDNMLSPFPERSEKLVRKSYQDSIEEIEVFCVCRLPDNGKTMIQCTKCTEWYHKHCVSVPKKHLHLDWFCGNCKH